MKNSAAITDVQKAEKRAWLVEQDNAILKQDLTSLKLTNERLENMIPEFREEDSSAIQNMSISDDIFIPEPPNGEMDSDLEDCLSHNKKNSIDNSILGNNQAYTNRMDYYTNYGLASPTKDTGHSKVSLSNRIINS